MVQDLDLINHLGLNKIRYLLELNFSSSVRPNEPDLKIEISKEAANNSETLEVYYCLQPYQWYEIDSIDVLIFKYKLRDDSIINNPIPLSALLSKASFLYFLPGVLWAICKDIDRRDEFDPEFYALLWKLTRRDMDEFRSIDTFDMKFQTLTQGQKCAIAHCLSYIAIHSLSDEPNNPHNLDALVALNSYWIDYLPEELQQELISANLIFQVPLNE